MQFDTATRRYHSWLETQTRIVPADLKSKRQKMAEGRFPFLRATFYRWVQLWPEVCRELAAAPTVNAVGDIHIENFGTWRDADTRLIWGVNDLDEAHPMAYTNDLVRLAASACVADEESQLAVNPKIICDKVLEGYREGLKAGGAPFVLEENNDWLRDIALGELRDPDKFWEKLLACPRFDDALPGGARRILDASMPTRKLKYTVRLRSAGLGSLGRRRFAAIATWHGSGVAREAKARVPSACVWAWKSDAADSQKAILEGAVRAPDPTFAMTAKWTVRRLAPHCSKVEVADMPSQRAEENLLQAMGSEIANIHLASKRAAGTVQQDLDRRGAGWLRDGVRQMLKQLDLDFKALRQK